MNSWAPKRIVVAMGRSDNIAEASQPAVGREIFRVRVPRPEPFEYYLEMRNISYRVHLKVIITILRTLLHRKRNNGPASWAVRHPKLTCLHRVLL